MSSKGPIHHIIKHYGVWIAYVGAMGLALYPVVIDPYFNSKKWKDYSSEARTKAGIKQEDIQPGDMKVWTDPFDRQGKPGNK